MNGVDFQTRKKKLFFCLQNNTVLDFDVEFEQWKHTKFKVVKSEFWYEIYTKNKSLKFEKNVSHKR